MDAVCGVLRRMRGGFGQSRGRARLIERRWVRWGFRAAFRSGGGRAVHTHHVCAFVPPAQSAVCRKCGRPCWGWGLAARPHNRERWCVLGVCVLYGNLSAQFRGRRPPRSPQVRTSQSGSPVHPRVRCRRRARRFACAQLRCKCGRRQIRLGRWPEPRNVVGKHVAKSSGQAAFGAFIIKCVNQSPCTPTRPPPGTKKTSGPPFAKTPPPARRRAAATPQRRNAEKKRQSRRRASAVRPGGRPGLAGRPPGSRSMGALLA